MNEFQQQLRELRNKVEKLINLHERLMAENHELKAKNERLEEAMKFQNVHIKELEEKNKVIKLAQVVSESDQNTRDIKMKINEYIREIDKCLALINR